MLGLGWRVCITFKGLFILGQWWAWGGRFVLPLKVCLSWANVGPEVEDLSDGSRQPGSAANSQLQISKQSIIQAMETIFVSTSSSNFKN